MGKRNPHQDLDHVKIQNQHLQVLYYGVDLALEILPPSLNVTRGRKNTGDACEKIKRMILPEQNSLEIMVICYKMKYNQINKFVRLESMMG